MGLTKAKEKKLKSYFEYEGKAYYSKKDMEKVLLKLDMGITLLSLRRSGLIVPVVKGKIYKVLEKNESLIELLNLLFNEEGLFYIGGMFVYNKYGFVEQLASGYQVINTRYKDNRKLDIYNVLFKKRKPQFFYGISETDYLPDKERALIDFCYDFGFYRTRSTLNSQRFDLKKLTEYCLQYPISSVARRILYYIDKKTELPDKIKSKVNSRSLITLYEKNTRRGSIDKRWNIIING